MARARKTLIFGLMSNHSRSQALSSNNSVNRFEETCLVHRKDMSTFYYEVRGRQNLLTVNNNDPLFFLLYSQNLKCFHLTPVDAQRFYCLCLIMYLIIINNDICKQFQGFVECFVQMYIFA